MHQLHVYRAMNMGSAASNTVKTIEIDQKSDKYDRPTSSSKKKKKDHVLLEREIDDLNTKLELCQDSLNQARQKSSDAEHETKALEKQMSELESTNVDLKEQIQSLEDKLEYMNTQNMIVQDNTPTEGLRLKDKMIDKLQSRTKEIEDEISMLRTKYKKKLKRINSQLAESKQDSTLKLFELRDQLTKQTEEKTKLEERLSRANSASSRRGDNDDFEDGDSGVGWEDNRTKVILELSRKVSEQSQTIDKMEQQLKHKDSVIQQYKVLLKENGISSEIDESLLSGGDVEVSVWKRSTSSVSQHSTNEQRTNIVSRSQTQDGDESSDLKSIAREMQRLKKTKSRDRERKQSRDDNRQSSGTSRDSGMLDVCKPPSGGKSRRLRSGDASQRISSAASTLSTVSEQDAETGSRVVVDDASHLLNEESDFSASQSSLRSLDKAGSKYVVAGSAHKRSNKKHADRYARDGPDYAGFCVDPIVKATSGYSVPSST